MKATPIATSRKRFETKYGMVMSPTPQTNGTTACCFLPYQKKPNPTEPNTTPHKSAAMLTVVSRVISRPASTAPLTLRSGGRGGGWKHWGGGIVTPLHVTLTE